jgi:hypothetical protein
MEYNVASIGGPDWPHSNRRGSAMSVARLLAAAILASPLLMAPLRSQAQDTDDKQIKKQIIAECLALYQQSRPCPCPYSRSCWVSAWLVPGGAKPFCYDSDISKDEIAQYQSGNNTFIASRCTARR